MSKVLLLNPPGTRPYLRDYYCSKVAKADYIYEPVDLLMLSGMLAETCRQRARQAAASEL